MESNWSVKGQKRHNTSISSWILQSKMEKIVVMKLNKKVLLLKSILFVSIALFSYGVAGVTYTLISNHSHSSFSWSIGTTVVLLTIPGTTNASDVNFTLKALNTGSTQLNNLWVNVTIDEHPNSTGQSFILNNVIALNQTNPQWIVDGPFSLGSNEAKSFSFDFRFSGVFGFYDIDATILRLQ